MSAKFKEKSFLFFFEKQDSKSADPNEEVHEEAPHLDLYYTQI